MLEMDELKDRESKLVEFYLDRHYHSYPLVMIFRGHDILCHVAGICRVVAPQGWTPSKNDYSNCKMPSFRPYHLFPKNNDWKDKDILEQTMSINEARLRNERENLLRFEYVQQKSMEIWKFFETHMDNKTIILDMPVEQLKRQITNLVSKTAVIVYGKDHHGTFFDEDLDILNLNKLNTFYSRSAKWPTTKTTEGAGLITSYLYASTVLATFSDHCEDVFAMSINYHHGGASTLWRGTPPSFCVKQAQYMSKRGKLIYPKLFTECQKAAMHKCLFASDDFLDGGEILYNWIEQVPRTFIITFPFIFHAGINLGPNSREAVNFHVDKNFANGAISNFMCNNPECNLGINTNLTCDGFAEKGLNPENYALWQNDELFIKDPTQFTHSDMIHVGKSIENKIPMDISDGCLMTKDEWINLSSFYDED